MTNGIEQAKPAGSGKRSTNGARGRLGWFAGAVLGLLFPVAAQAQSASAPFTSGIRYDLAHRITGTIAADPDGGGDLHHAAVRNTFDSDGNLVSTETGELAQWQSEDIPPASWSGFTVFRTTVYLYDGMGRKMRETLSAGGARYAVTQYSYDGLGSLVCTAVRMNVAAFDSLPADACQLGPEGSQGPDRITRNVHDAAGQVLKVQKAVGTALQQDYATFTYSANGKQLAMIDANGNKATMVYDGFDRQTEWHFPDKVAIGTASVSDYEAYGYDANGNRVSLRKRDGRTIGYTYDALNRVTVKDIPGGTAADVYYGYDLRGLQTYARFASSSGAGIATVYDGFGRPVTSTTDQGGTTRTLSFQYDADGNRTRITHPDGVYFAHVFDGLDRMTNATWYHTGSGTVPFMGISYDPQGRRSGTGRASSTTTYEYDAVSRPTRVLQNFAGNSGNVANTLAYNPANQITSLARDNSDYAFGGYVSVSRAYATNGLNQYTSAGPAVFSYDANGNLTGDGTRSFGYDVENRLVSSGAVTLAYDPLGRLWQTSGAASGTTQFLYDGDALVAEYDGDTGALRRRYMHGPGVDETILWDEGATMNCSGTRFLHTDHHGSVVAVADCFGNRIAVDTYDEYGIPGAGNIGRFQYTGQAWLPELGLYYYKARIYSPTLGRFLQTDPIGYDDQNNLYAYVGNDPINGRDPSGLKDEDDKPSPQEEPIVVTGRCRGIKCDRSPPPPPPIRGTVFRFIDREIRTPQKKDDPCGGKYRTVAFGGSVTAALFAGVNISASIGTTTPIGGGANRPQLFFSFQISGMLGVGGFLGAGVTGSVGQNQGGLKTVSSGGFAYGEADVGAGASVGVSGQAGGGSGSVTAGLPVPKIGAGAGAYAGVGAGYGVTAATGGCPR